MPHVRIIINSRTLIDRPLDLWQSRPPDEFADMIKPGHKPEPGMQALQIALADALTRNAPFDAVLNTHENSWKLQVRYP